MTLIDKLSALTGPDREVDLIIMRWVGNIGGPSKNALPYTASIDSALTLMPDGQHWQVGVHPSTGQGQAYLLTLKLPAKHIFVTAATPAIALCIAALKARDLT